MEQKIVATAGQRRNARNGWRWAGAVLFVVAGLGHFLRPDFYSQIVPPFFPAPLALVYISGVCEMAGGLGLLIPRMRRLAGWGLIALLIAVFPANIYMALYPHRFGFSPVLLWARLPFQGVLAGWIWWIALCRDRRSSD